MAQDKIGCISNRVVRDEREQHGASDTETLIKDTFWDILEEKPYEKVTVREIAERCGLNRNTFYYHFESIPELLMETVSDWVVEIADKDHAIKSPIDLIIPLALACRKRQKAILHIYHSRDRETVQKGFDRLAHSFAERYVAGALKADSRTTEEKELLVRLTKSVVKGILEDWLENEMEYDLVQYAVQIRRILGE